MNTVQALLTKPFSKRTQHERVETLKMGRHTPMLKIEKACVARSRAYNRSFKPEVYKQHEWICGCDVINALFCFPCILFGGDNTWTRSGMADLNHLAARIKHHQNSATHLNNEATMCVVRSGDVMGRVQEDGEVAKNNDKVKQNRYIISKIVDCLKFCGAYELAMDESKGRGVFRGLLDFTAELDGAMRDHLEKATVFKGTSPLIRNELLDCLFSVIRDKIAEEIKNAAFVALICDDTTDDSGVFEKAVIFRYEVKGKIVERFWGFLNPSEDETNSVSHALLNAMAPLLAETPDKLVSQSYDGATSIEETVDVVKAVYPNAHLVHCYAHDLQAVMRQATSSTSQPIRTFFHNLATVPDFFADPTHTVVLEAIVADPDVKTVARRWSFQTRVVNTVHDHVGPILECARTIENTTLKESTLNQASSLRRQLQDPDFLFWLAVFHHLTPHVDILYKSLSLATLPGVVCKAVNNFQKAVAYVRGDMDAIVGELTALPEERSKRLHVAAVRVCDFMERHVRERFAFVGHVQACNLLSANRFCSYNATFPQEELDAAKEAYPFLDHVRLKTELSVVYDREDFQILKKGIARLYIYMTLNNMCGVFKEVTRLAKILLTTPMMACPENEPSLSASCRLRTFLRRGSVATDRLQALAMLTLERDLVTEMKDLNDLVIDKFAAMKSRRIELVYQ